MEATWIPYCGAAPVPAGLMARWNLDPLVLLVLAAAGVWLWRRGESRAAGALAVALLLLLFVSPFCALTSALFSARVAHHVLLTAIAAPLLALALPRIRVPGGVVVWTAIHAVLFWLWHAPPLYGFALSSVVAYWLMQASLLGSAFGFWSALRREPPALGVALLLAAMVQMGLLGALITFAGAPLYTPHWLTTQAWGLTPIEDQQLAGLIMWAPASGIYLGAALLLAWRALGGTRRMPA